jgi:hypothetical protein
MEHCRVPAASADARVPVLPLGDASVAISVDLGGQTCCHADQTDLLEVSACITEMMGGQELTGQQVLVGGPERAKPVSGLSAAFDLNVSFQEAELVGSEQDDVLAHLNGTSRLRAVLGDADGRINRDHQAQNVTKVQGRGCKESDAR